MKANGSKTKSTGLAPAKKAGANGRRPARAKVEKWNLRLYVAGQTAKSLAAFANLKRFCEEHLAGHYHIEVIDLVKQPKLAMGDQIVAIPTLVRRLPPPIKRVIGDLSDTERVMVGMDLRPLLAGGNKFADPRTKTGL